MANIGRFLLTNTGEWVKLEDVIKTIDSSFSFASGTTYKIQVLSSDFAGLRMSEKSETPTDYEGFILGYQKFADYTKGEADLYVKPNSSQVIINIAKV